MDLYHLACTQAWVLLHRELPAVVKYMDGQDLHPTCAFKAMELWRTLLAERPKVIYEIGCGSTTAVLASYAERYGAKVVSTEDKMEYFEKCDRRLGVLRHSIHLNLVPLIAVDDTVAHYAAPPAVPPPDLLYVDGPASTNGELRADARNFAAAGLLPGLIMFDFGFRTVADFAGRHSSLYRIEIGWAQAKHDEWFLTKFQHHSFAWRR